MVVCSLFYEIEKYLGNMVMRCPVADDAKCSEHVSQSGDPSEEVTPKCVCPAEGYGMAAMQVQANTRTSRSEYQRESSSS